MKLIRTNKNSEMTNYCIVHTLLTWQTILKFCSVLEQKGSCIKKMNWGQSSDTIHCAIIVTKTAPTCPSLDLASFHGFLDYHKAYDTVTANGLPGISSLAYLIIKLCSPLVVHLYVICKSMLKIYYTLHMLIFIKVHYWYSLTI